MARAVSQKFRVTRISDGDRVFVMTEEKENRRGGGYGQAFVTVFPEALAVLNRETRLAPALRVLVWAWGKLNFESFRELRQTDVAVALGCSQATVGLGLRQLLELGFIEREGAGPRQVWRLTPEGGWRGHVARFNVARRERASDAKLPEGTITARSRAGIAARKLAKRQGRSERAALLCLDGGKHGEGATGEKGTD